MFLWTFCCKKILLLAFCLEETASPVDRVMFSISSRAARHRISRVAVSASLNRPVVSAFFWGVRLSSSSLVHLLPPPQVFFRFYPTPYCLFFSVFFRYLGSTVAVPRARREAWCMYVRVALVAVWFLSFLCFAVVFRFQERRIPGREGMGCSPGTHPWKRRES